MPWAHQEIQIPRGWDKIFRKDTTWLKEMGELQEIKPSILPTLIGCDLHELSDASKPSYLILLVHDWSGELRYAQGNFFNSLKGYRKVNAKEIHIIESNITINVMECLGHSSASGQISMKDPSKIFSRRKGHLTSSLLYYGDDTIYDVDPRDIGGIENRLSIGTRAVRNISSIKMKLGNGNPVYRVFVRDKWDGRVRSIITTDENGRQWVTRWREIKSGWREE